MSAIEEAIARSGAIAQIRLGPDVLAEAAAVLRRHFPGNRVVVIADDNTFEAAGRRVTEVLVKAGAEVTTHVLDGTPRPKPTVELGVSLAATIGNATPIAVGSGVINDLVKFAAFKLGRPYLCVPTAASMDGYSSAGAPLSEFGFKKTIPCRAPLAILADLGVIAAAPTEMSGWGYGDLAGKVPAGGDWIVADALGVEGIDDVAWPLVQGNLGGWLADPAAVRRGDADAVARLFEGLTLSGLAMEFHGTSRPASGADHQIAHMWEMEDLRHEGERVSHGACVAIGCLITLALYDWLLEQDLTALPVEEVVRSAPSLADKKAEIARLLDPSLGRRAVAETEAKHLCIVDHRARLGRVAQAWPELSARLGDHLMRAPEMTRLLAEAGAPTRSEDIGVSREHLRQTVRAARFIRSRYTVLDLLEECGLFEAALDATIPARSRAA
jgi:glycerol-1-phosphate dehydrogenase [NAD(P)+]